MIDRISSSQLWDIVQEKTWLLHIGGTVCKLSQAGLSTVGVHQGAGWNVLDQVIVKIHLGNGLSEASCSLSPTENVIL